MILLRAAVLGIALLFLLPAGLSVLVWKLGEHPASWSTADWSSAAILPLARDDETAAVYVLAARTGGLKGALSEHSWVVLKPRGASAYERFDKVGWGSPIRRNGYAADGRWYSNTPRLVAELKGEAAERAIPKVRAAIESYPFAARGGYRIFPGPNSNSFVAHVLHAVPELGAVLPPTAVGRDFPVDGRLVTLDTQAWELRASLYGYAGFAIGARSGLELQFLGLVAGVDPLRGLLKVPGFGNLSITG